LVALGACVVRSFPLSPRRGRREWRVAAMDVNKRMGDAVALAGLSLYQQGVEAMTESGSLGAPVDLNVGSAFIRGCRLSLCLFCCEKLFKALRAPASKREVPVPIEAAAMAVVVNLGLEYSIAASFEPIPKTLAMSLGGTPIETAVVYLTIIAWRIVYAASQAPTG